MTTWLVARASGAYAHACTYDPDALEWAAECGRRLRNVDPGPAPHCESCDAIVRGSDELVLGCIRAGYRSRVAIEQEARLSKGVAAKALARLLKAGRILSVGRGNASQYVLAGAVRDAS